MNSCTMYIIVFSLSIQTPCKYLSVYNGIHYSVQLLVLCPEHSKDSITVPTGLPVCLWLYRSLYVVMWFIIQIHILVSAGQREERSASKCVCGSYTGTTSLSVVHLKVTDSSRLQSQTYWLPTHTHTYPLTYTLYTHTHTLTDSQKHTYTQGVKGSVIHTYTHTVVYGVNTGTIGWVMWPLHDLAQLQLLWLSVHISHSEFKRWNVWQWWCIHSMHVLRESVICSRQTDWLTERGGGGV